MSPTFGSRARKHTHTSKFILTQAESAGRSCSNTAACNQSIDQWIDGHDNGQPQPAGPSIPPPERGHGRTAGASWETTSRKSLSDARACDEEALVASQQWIPPQQHTHTLLVGLNSKKNESCLIYIYICIYIKNCKAAHTAQIERLSSAAASLPI